MKRKSQSSFIAGILFITILVAGVSIAYVATKPRLDSMKDVAQVEQAMHTMSIIDEAARAVSSEGSYSTRKVSLSISDGTIRIEDLTDKVYYNLKTKSKIVSPRSSTKSRNLIIYSNSDVSINQYSDYYILENQHLRLNLIRNGTSSSYANISTGNLLTSIYFKDDDKTINDGFAIKIDNALVSGTGYSYTTGTGSDITKGTVIYHIEFSQDSVSYSADIYITLETGADFIITEVKNFERL